MKIKAVLFDLDGTLLNMDLDSFSREYFKNLCEYLAQYGYDDARLLVKTVLDGIKAIEKNDGTRINEDVFWDVYCGVYSVDRDEAKSILSCFYECKFEQVKSVCGVNPEAAGAVKCIGQMGLKMAVATKPIFPLEAVVSRIRWAGLDEGDFEYYTCYENSGYSKPNPEYYRAVAKAIGVLPEECLMVGNDVNEDMTAEEAGMKVFLLDYCVENRDGKDITVYRSGGFNKLVEYIEELI